MISKYNVLLCRFISEFVVTSGETNQRVYVNELLLVTKFEITKGFLFSTVVHRFHPPWKVSSELD